MYVVSDEVSQRSHSSITELSIVYFHEFLIEQLSSLTPQIENAKQFKNGIQDCEFFQQLKRHGERFIRNGGMQSKLSKMSKDDLRELYGKNALLQSLYGDLVASLIYPSPEKKRTAKEEVPKLRIKYPIEDNEFWSSEKLYGRHSTDQVYRALSLLHA